MKIGIPLQSLTYPLQRVMGRNREVDLIPLKFTKMLEPTLSSGYHGVFSCTRDIRYPYRKKKICFLSWASSYIHLFWVDLGVVQGDRISSFLGEILYWFCEEFLLKLSFKFPSPGPASPSWIFWICPCLYEPLLTLTSVNVLVSTVKICVANQLILSLQ